MKTTTSIGLSLIAALALGSASLAQPPGGEGGKPRGGERRGGERSRGGEERGGGRISREIVEQLGLTPDQKTKFESLLEKQRDEQSALRTKHLEQVNALLTPDQRKKLEEARARQRGGGNEAPGGRRRGGGGA